VTERTASRLERLLVLVPWVVAHPGVSIAEVCNRFGIARTDLMADLDVLFLCGLPPFGPGDLIEVVVDGDAVTIDMADYLARPLRLTRHEAVTLLAIGRAIASVPAFDGAESLRSALVKLERAVASGEADAARDAASRVDIDVDAGPSETLTGLREAIAKGRRVSIEYYSFGRDEMSERVVCPLVVFAAAGNWYLEAFDGKSGERRVFRVDRIRRLDPAGTCTHAEAHGSRREPPASLFAPGEHDLQATIEIAPSAAWVRETTPYERATTLSDGWTRLVVRTPNLAWLERLVLRLGDDVRAVQPPELADGMREVARDALARYGPVVTQTNRRRRAGRAGSQR
jgi:proteasome accessory factor C